jgi:sulfatase modifying factor 1
VKDRLVGLVIAQASALLFLACSGPGGGPATDGGGAESSSSSGGGSSSGGAQTAPSCQAGGPGLTDCGTSHENCCTTLEVPGGTYSRTYDETDAGVPVPPPNGVATNLADPATISAFRLDKYDVTVGRFRQFVKAWNGGAGYTPPSGSGKHTHLNGGQGLVNSGNDGGVDYESGWVASDDQFIDPTDANLSAACGVASSGSWTSAVGAQEDLPIDCVNWYEGYAFCIWDGGFLPSEAEWEFAAAGGSDQREYPWGSAPPGTTDQYAIITDGLGAIIPSPVGLAPAGAGRWGQLDLDGNMWQWTLDFLAGYVSPCDDCAYLATTPYRTLRGGRTFVNTASYLYPPSRNASPPTNRATIGFRCARTP